MGQKIASINVTKSQAVANNYKNGHKQSESETIRHKQSQAVRIGDIQAQAVTSSPNRRHSGTSRHKLSQSGTSSWTEAGVALQLD